MVEIGCGSGHNLAHLVAYFGTTGIGVDRDAKKIARARLAYGHLPGIRFILADAVEHLASMKQASVDVCLSIFGAFSFADPTSLLTVASQAIRPGGFLAMTLRATDHHDSVIVLRRRGSTLIGVDTGFLERVRSAALAGMPDEPVAFAYLFGSRAVGGARADSDADIAILPARGLSAEQRAALRNRVAEIIEPAARAEVDVVLLDEAPLPLRGRILSQRQILYSADEPLRVRWESLTGRMYADSRIKLDLLDQDLLIETAAGRR